MPHDEQPEMAPMTNIRQATPQDAPAIAAIQALCWPENSPDPNRVAAIIAEPDHITTVIVQDGVLTGFMDSFLTLSQDGTHRWEMDLLAVHPNSRGKGQARVLIGANFGAARRLGAAFARALIHADNLPSQRAFARAGFSPAPLLNRLLVTGNGTDTGQPAPPDAHLIPVQTLGYAGVWVEGVISPAALNAAQSVRARFGWDVAGCVIPLEDTAALNHAAQASYDPVGDYRWWIRPYP